MAKAKKKPKLRERINAVFSALRGDITATVTETNEWQRFATGIRKVGLRGTDEFDSDQKSMAERIDAAWQRDPIMFRVVDDYDKLALGSGLTMTSENEKALPPARAIWRENNLDDLQHAAAIELTVTGNVFARVPKMEKPTAAGESTVPSIDLIPSLQIDKIVTDETGRITHYLRKWTEQSYGGIETGVKEGAGVVVPKPKAKYEFIPADEIVHVKINAAAGDVRGISPLAPTWRWSQTYLRTLQTTYNLSLARSLVIMHAAYEGGNSESIAEMLSTFESNTVRRTDPQGFDFDVFATGQVIGTNEKVTITPIGAEVSGRSMDSEMRRLLLAVAAGVGIPEVLLSDGDYSNLASSTNQMAPFFRLVKSIQQKIIQLFRGCFELAFDRMDQYGLLNGVVPDQDKDEYHKADVLDITGPEIETTDISTLANSLVSLTSAKIISKQQACEQLNLDWKEIQQQIADEKSAGGDDTDDTGVEQNPGYTFPFGALNHAIRAAADPTTDPKGKPRHAETFKTLKRLLGNMHTEINTFKTALVAAGSDFNKKKAAYDAFTSAVFSKLHEMQDVTRAMGRKEANAND